jgi:hypothetical protein
MYLRKISFTYKQKPGFSVGQVSNLTTPSEERCVMVFGGRKRTKTRFLQGAFPRNDYIQTQSTALSQVFHKKPGFFSGAVYTFPRVHIPGEVST